MQEWATSHSWNLFPEAPVGKTAAIRAERHRGIEEDGCVADQVALRVAGDAQGSATSHNWITLSPPYGRA